MGARTRRSSSVRTIRRSQVHDRQDIRRARTSFDFTDCIVLVGLIFYTTRPLQNDCFLFRSAVVRRSVNAHLSRLDGEGSLGLRLESTRQEVIDLLKAETIGWAQ
jgi:hypothetical protein